jgi:hypothetical protein
MNTESAASHTVMPSPKKYLFAWFAELALLGVLVACSQNAFHATAQ